MWHWSRAQYTSIVHNSHAYFAFGHGNRCTYLHWWCLQGGECVPQQARAFHSTNVIPLWLLPSTENSCRLQLWRQVGCRHCLDFGAPQSICSWDCEWWCHQLTPHGGDKCVAKLSLGKNQLRLEYCCPPCVYPVGRSIGRHSHASDCWSSQNAIV